MLCFYFHCFVLTVGVRLPFVETVPDTVYVCTTAYAYIKHDSSQFTTCNFCCAVDQGFVSSAGDREAGKKSGGRRSCLAARDGACNGKRVVLLSPYGLIAVSTSDSRGVRDESVSLEEGNSRCQRYNHSLSLSVFLHLSKAP